MPREPPVTSTTLFGKLYRTIAAPLLPLSSFSLPAASYLVFCTRETPLGGVQNQVPRLAATRSGDAASPRSAARRG